MRADLRFLGHPRTRRLAVAALVALAAAFVVAALSGSGSATATGRLGGDFPEFYGAGRIVADGDIAHLYDRDWQAASQAGLYGHEDDGLLYFGYPPHVALAYAPLSILPYRLAWVLHTAAMAGAALLALALLRPVLRPLQRAYWPCAALALTFAPLFVGLGCGQNTALTLLLVAASWRLVHEGEDVAGGVALGLLLFKPQYALVLLALHAIGGRRRVLLGAGVTAAATWVADAALMGAGWTSSWLAGLRSFGSIDAASNRKTTVSVRDALEAMFGTNPGVKVAGVAAFALVAALAVVCWRSGGRRDLTAAMAVAIPAMLLLAPHALYYDAGLLVLTALVVLDRRGDNPRVLAAVAACWVAGLAYGWTQLLGVTPVFVVVVTGLVGAVGTMAATTRLGDDYGRYPTLATGSGSGSRRARTMSSPASRTSRRSRGSIRSS